MGAAVQVIAGKVPFHDSGKERSNVIFILAGDVGYECIGVYRGPCLILNIGSKTEEWILFMDFHSQPPGVPTDIQIMTSKYKLKYKNFV